MTLGGTIAGVLLAFFQAGHHPAAQEHDPCALLRQGDLPPAPAAPAGSACRDLARLARAAEEEQARRDAAIAALGAGRCAEGRALAGLSGDTPRRPDRLLLAAEMHMTGICAPRDPRRAARLLDAALTRDPLLPEAAVLLGALKWSGRGTRQDRRQARRLAETAAFLLIARRIRAAARGLPISGDRPRFALLSDREINFRYFNRKLRHLRTLAQQDPPRMARLASRRLHARSCPLRAGALDLLRALTLLPDAHQARLLYGAALFSESGRPRPQNWPPCHPGEPDFLRAFSLLVDEAVRANRKAMRRVVAILKAGAVYERRDWALYYWTKHLGRLGDRAAEAEARAREARLPSSVRTLLDDWPAPDPIHPPVAPFTLLRPLFP
ncbi:MAG: hypothetical protein KatS3mg119_1872 [Rhodothalassiaceae bacterium]|nr:MAG: hypothetical protein KatS3mg119_1872 [Rhodothalassiaceae bacterium]